MASLAFRNARLLDVEEGCLRDGSLRVEGERIVELSDRGDGVEAARVIDLRGRVLMPGLVDAHVHVAITSINFSAMWSKPTTLIAIEAAGILERMLGRGFTTVRDAGGADQGLAEAVAQGLIPGPRIHYSGRVLSQTGGHGDFRPRGDLQPVCACSVHSTGFAHVADGVDAVRRAAREELRRGATQLKIMASGGVASPTDPIWNLQYSREEMRAIVEEAESWRTYAMAHAYTPEAIRRAVEAGVRTIEHGNLLDAATARLMAERGAYLVPTLVTYFVLDEIGSVFALPAESSRKLKDVLKAGLSSLEIAKTAGVPMGFGTDLLGETHDQQSREFRIRREVQSAAEVLRSATVVNAEILRRSGEIGVLREGALADLLVLDGNPLDDIAILEDASKMHAVVQGGRIAVDRGI